MIHTNHTPMMQQYLKIKQDYPDMLIFYRMGDFYELFFDDAKIASSVLGITLTSRGKTDDTAIPMAGVPFHSASQYVQKLIKNNISVVMVEQVGEVQAKGPMERKVSKVITPGTVSDDNLLYEKQENFLAAIHSNKKHIGISMLSISSGKFYCMETDNNQIENYLGKYLPSEIIVKQSELREYKNNYPNYNFIAVEDWFFEAKLATKELLSHFSISSFDPFGLDNKKHLNAIIASHIALYYAKWSQKVDLSHISTLLEIKKENSLIIDIVCSKNLELTKNTNGGYEYSLLSIIDNCVTSMGSRTLNFWLNNISIDLNQINLRQDAVVELSNSYSDIQTLLKSISDLERISSRLALSSIRPRDFIAIKNSLLIISKLTYLAEYQSNLVRDYFIQDQTWILDLYNKIDSAIMDEPNNLIRDGNVINSSYSAELDYLRNIQGNGSQFILDLELSERERSGITTLKIEYNKIQGYYIEVSKLHESKIPIEYKRTQTLKNVERYIIPELKKFEIEVLSAQDKALDLEKNLYAEIITESQQYIDKMQHLANYISQLDVLCGFAKLAKIYNWTRPVFNNDNILNIISGKHPVLSYKLTDKFIANDISLNTDTRFLTITGPNMGGKSTYMRQTALIIILAYLGSHVSADLANIPKIDRVFARIGATDDLSQGKSTFMVEMAETANIINNATSNSLVLIDEIGRGTSTLDGLALAHSIAVELVSHIGCYTLFATHYFELTSLNQYLPEVCNIHLDAIEHDNKIVFMHNVKLGAATKSYGINVASLAGIKTRVVGRAQKYLNKLEIDKIQANQLDLFSLNQDEISSTTTYKELYNEVSEINPDILSAKEALDLIYKLTNFCKEHYND